MARRGRSMKREDFRSLKVRTTEGEGGGHHRRQQIYGSGFQKGESWPLREHPPSALPPLRCLAFGRARRGTSLNDQAVVWWLCPNERCGASCAPRRGLAPDEAGGGVDGETTGRGEDGGGGGARDGPVGQQPFDIAVA